MADYYTSFSVLLPLPDVEDAESKVKDWIAERLREYEDREEGGSVNLEWDNHSKRAWLYEESEGDVEYAAELIQHYLNFFDIEDGVFMSWAGTCSKPRVNESVGGGVVVTRDDSIWVNSYDVVREASEAGIDVIN